MKRVQLRSATASLVAWLTPFLAGAQSLPEVLKQGEEVFNLNCATAYCHGPKGGAGGATRLAARGFDEAFINATVTRGVAGTAMVGFGTKLSRSELVAVVAYVASLNGITNPTLAAAPANPAGAAPRQTLSPAASRGRDLFFDAVRGEKRCATCHEVGDLGIPVTTAISSVPQNAQALRALVSSHVGTAMLGGDSMPALVVSRGSRAVIFYDLTVAPPVLHTADPADVKVTEGSTWRHSSAIGSYTDEELESILAFLRAPR